jgi:hypothetical protein
MSIKDEMGNYDPEFTETVWYYLTCDKYAGHPQWQQLIKLRPMRGNFQEASFEEVAQRISQLPGATWAQLGTDVPLLKKHYLGSLPANAQQQQNAERKKGTQQQDADRKKGTQAAPEPTKAPRDQRSRMDYAGGSEDAGYAQHWEHYEQNRHCH